MLSFAFQFIHISFLMYAQGLYFMIFCLSFFFMYKNNHKNILFVLLILVGSVFLQNCTSTKLPENDSLLRRQTIVGYENLRYEDVYPLLRQKTNRFFLGTTPYVSFYTAGKKRFVPEKIEKKMEEIALFYDRKIDEINKKYEKELDERVDVEARQEIIRTANRKKSNVFARKKKKLDHLAVVLAEGNWLMRVVGEKPTFYDSIIAKTTTEALTDRLKEKGFFQGKATIEKKVLKNDMVALTYKIQENQRTFFGKLDIFTENPNIDSLLNAHKSASEIVEGKPYDRERIDAERKRIETLLKNNGYIYFSIQYVSFNIDTLHFVKIDSLNKDILRKDMIKNDKTKDKKNTIFKRYANIELDIKEPARGTHKAWDIANVYFHANRPDVKSDTLISKETQITYIDRLKRAFSYKLLDQRTRIRPKSIYNQLQLTETQRLLGNLDMFRFVSIKEDTSQHRLDMHIFTNPADKYQITDEIGFNVIQGLPGPFVNLTFKMRNIFKGAEIFETGVRFAIDGQTSFSEDNQFYSSQEYGVNTSLVIPKVLFPRKLIPRRLRQNIETYSPTTRFILGYNFVRRPEYTRANLTASMSFKGQLKNSTYNFTVGELSIVNTLRKSESFSQQLLLLSQEGNPILQSFDRALVSSIYFIYTYNNNNGNETKKSHFIRVLAESGGNTLNILNETPFKTGDRIFGLKYFQYWRGNVTFNYYLPISKGGTSLAFRTNVGIAQAYGGSLTLPYEKFFFAGGGSSVRAWRPRRLGPGENSPNVRSDGTFDNRLEQPGEIILEGNVEYRFPLFSLFKWAFFVDAGNVWTWKEETARGGTQFKWDSFVEQIAIGSGFGLRMNLPFLLLRFDLGIKVYDPARRFDRRWVIQQFNAGQAFSKEYAVLNLGIGYPF